MPEYKEIRSAAVKELRVHDDGDGPVIAGYAAVFDSLSEDLGGFRERVLPGAFTDTLQGKPDVRALIDHDSSKILGRTTAGTLAIKEDGKGLSVRINPPDTTAGSDILKSIKRGDIDQMSFAFQTVTDRWHTEDEEEIRELVEVKLFEVSIVAFPAYPDTSVAIRSNDPAVALRSLVLHQRQQLADRKRRTRVHQQRAILEGMRR